MSWLAAARAGLPDNGSGHRRRRPGQSRQVRQAQPASSASLSPFARGFLKPLDLPVARASYLMIIDHAHGLHDGIDDHGPAELEAALAHVLGDLFRQLRLRLNIPPMVELVHDRLVADEAPDIVG